MIDAKSREGTHLNGVGNLPHGDNFTVTPRLSSGGKKTWEKKDNARMEICVFTQVCQFINWPFDQCIHTGV